jgi:hypothetical protein
VEVLVNVRKPFRLEPASYVFDRSAFAAAGEIKRALHGGWREGHLPSAKPHPGPLATFGRDLPAIVVSADLSPALGRLALFKDKIG